MVGIFQVFSVSVLFWTIVSFLRFVFDTLHAFNRTWQDHGYIALLAMAGVGVGIAVVLFLLLLSEFELDTHLYARDMLSEIAFPALLEWLICVGVGSYIATRLHLYRPYLVASAVGFGSIAACITLIALTLGKSAFTSEVIFWLGGGSIVTLIMTFMSGYIADTVSAFEKKRIRRNSTVDERIRIRPHEVAIVIAAHNEELTIGSTIQSILAITTPEHIYVGSDGSNDKTVDVVSSLGCHADDIRPNRGKARAITYVLEKNKILSRYKAMFLLDADIAVNDTFYHYALPHFDDPHIVSVSGCLEAVWPRHCIPRWEFLVTAYRVRLWRVLQFLVRYGQTWVYTNVSPIIPGAASIYRTSVLKQIDIDAPGLVIEDFNMTFEVHHKRLGLIVFEPRARVYNQEPYSVHDFFKQVRRWYLGYFQTIRKHGLWPSSFCVSTYFLTLELLLSSFLFLLIPFLALELLLSNRDMALLDFVMWKFPISLLTLFIAAFVTDYIVTIGVALVEKKPLLLLYGLAFFLLRFIESAAFLMMLPRAFLWASDGKWVSPERKVYPFKRVL